MNVNWAKKSLAARRRIWRFSVPVWAVAVGAGLTLVAAGQAVGPILTGSVSGLAGATVSQSIVMDGVEFRDWPPTLLYSVSPRDDQLRVVSTVNGAETTSVTTVTLVAEVIEGINAIAADPTDNDKLYALLKLQGQSGRELVTIDPSTGVATDIGDTGDRFAGLAFTSAGVLYAVTGDGAGVPETLYTLDTSTAVPTAVLTLGNGNDGETLAFDPDNGLLYHASGEGIPNVNEIFESIDPNLLTVTSITLAGQDYAEATALTYEGNRNFLLADLGRRLFHINTDGFSEYVGVLDHDTHGLVPFDLAHVDDSLAVLNDEGTHFTAAIEPHVGDTYMLIIHLENLSDADASAMLEVDVPEAIDVDAYAVGAIEAAQLGKRSWLVRIPSTISEGDLRLVFKVRDNQDPGFYNVNARLYQIAG